MNILGLETSGPVCSVGLLGQEGILAERLVRGQKIHSVRLLPLIQEVLAEVGLLPKDLEAVAVSAGPGSFTGLRIGITVAKTLAQVLNIPVAGVPSLEVLAYQSGGGGGLVWVLVPARKGEVYAALYDCGADLPQAVYPPASLEIEQLLGVIRNGNESRLLVGEAVELYGEVLRRELNGLVRFGSPVLNYSRGALVAELGWKRLQEGDAFDAFNLVPDYLRPSAAELMWRQRVQG